MRIALLSNKETNRIGKSFHFRTVLPPSQTRGEHFPQEVLSKELNIQMNRIVEHLSRFEKETNSKIKIVKRKNGFVVS